MMAREQAIRQEAKNPWRTAVLFFAGLAVGGFLATIAVLHLITWLTFG